MAFLGGVAQADDPNEHAVSKAQVYAMETWPDEFAGLWLDFDYPHTLPAEEREEGIPADQKVFIAFTSGAEEKVAELRQKFPAANPYVAVTHAYSLATLQQLQRKVTGDLRAYMEGELEIPGPAFEWHATGIWVVDNVLEVNLSVVTPEYEAWAAERYAPMASALHIFAGPKVVPVADNLRPKPGLNKCGPACKKAKARKAKQRALKRKCVRAARTAKRTGSKKAKKLVRSKKCRALK